MELSLHGSQINLATREPTVLKQNYINFTRTQLRRPSSAAAQSYKNTTSVNLQKRPQSADINLNNNSNVIRNSKLKSKQLSFKQQQNNSSSNILNLLLTEPIAHRYKNHRFWKSNDDDSADSLGTKIRKKAMASGDKQLETNKSSDESECSVEEDINQESENEEEISGTSSPEALKDSKNNAVVQKSTSSNFKYAAWHDEHLATLSQNKKLDLPGRVSFSNSDSLLLGNLSDDSTEEHQISPYSRKTVHFSNPNPTIEETTENVSSVLDENLPCCPSKCSTNFGQSGIKLDSLESKEINDDFKERNQSQIKEIESVQSDLNSNENNIENHDNQMKETEIKFKTKYEDLVEPPNVELNWNNNNNSNNSIFRTNGGFKICNKNKITISNKKPQNIINNKIKHKSVAVSNLRDNSSQQSKNQNGLEKPPRKSKLISNLENAKIGQFHIDKIESWMSIYGSSESEDQRQFQPRPSSNKTDDEGNYSLEEHTRSNSSTDSSDTYDEIVEIIKEIDSDKKENSRTDKMSSIMEQENLNNIENIQMKLQALLKDAESTDTGCSAEDNEEGNDKMKKILTYLDDIDAKCNKTINDAKKYTPPNSDRCELEFSVESDIITDVPKLSDLLMFPNHQLARRIVNLTLRSNELSNAILLSKEHVSHIKNEKLKAIRQEKQNAQNRLTTQKKHYESIIQRHQGFIEQLLHDKSDLCEKLTAQTRRFDSQAHAMAHKLETEVQRAKETVIAGEKIRREKWVRENTKKIKELTVKGLEAELNKITAEHQTDLSELRQKHQDELFQTEEKARTKYEEIEKSLRESYANDREGAIERERLALRDRFENQMDMENKSFEQKRQRLLAECNSEKNRVYLELKEKEEMFESLKDEWAIERNNLIEQMKQNFCDKNRAQEAKHQSELSSLQKQFESDFAIWKREHETLFKRREMEREDVIRQQCRLERDRQIDSIVAKVDAESNKSQQEFDLKIMRIKEKYQMEQKELERSETQIRERFHETRIKLGECEAAIQNNQVTIKRLESELQHTKNMCDSLIQEKENFKENARMEMKIEIKTMLKERDMEIDKIHSRVQQAVEKKDAAIDYLQKENEMLKERCSKLEAVIRQQRKDYCVK